MSWDLHLSGIRERRKWAHKWPDSFFTDSHVVSLNHVSLPLWITFIKLTIEIQLNLWILPQCHQNLILKSSCVKYLLIFFCYKSINHKFCDSWGGILSFVTCVEITDDVMQTLVGNLVMEVLSLIHNWKIQLENPFRISVICVKY